MNVFRMVPTRRMFVVVRECLCLLDNV
jgi:hypothetical protein